MRETGGSSVSATDRLSMLKPRPLKRPATRARTPNSFSTRTEIVCRMAGSVRAVARQDLHDLVLAGELQLLEALLLHLLLGREVELLLVQIQLPLQVRVLLVVLPELRLSLQEGLDELLVLFLHAYPPRQRSVDLSMPKFALSIDEGARRGPCELGFRWTNVDGLEWSRIGALARGEATGTQPRHDAAARMVRRERTERGAPGERVPIHLGGVADEDARRRQLGGERLRPEHAVRPEPRERVVARRGGSR